MSENKYINVVYDEKVRKKTNYPNQLIQYLIERYNIKKFHLILDVGCGRGDFMEAFENNGINCFGVDLSNNNNKYVFECNFENQELPFKDNSFDFCFSKSVLEHLNSSENYLKEIYRVLKPNGKLIILVPDWISCIYLYYQDASHKQPYTKEALHDSLKIIGFKDVHTELFYQLPIIWKYPKLKYICKFLQLFGSPKKIVKNKFLRWSRELIILGSCVK